MIVAVDVFVCIWLVGWMMLVVVRKAVEEINEGKSRYDAGLLLHEYVMTMNE
jgi:hypothetical protein